MPCRGIRGANTVEANTAQSILEATGALLSRMIALNDLHPTQVASAIFTLTPDLDAEFPAKAARELGWTDVPLMCMTEIAKPGGLAKCVRILLQVNTDHAQADIHHVYLGGARALRPDLESKAEPTLTDLARPNIFRIAPYVPGKPTEEVQRELGLTDVIKLASNENPLGPSPKAQEALVRSISTVNLYPDGNVFRLKQTISSRLGVPTEQLIVGNGSDEIIKLLAEALLLPGDEIVIADPTFSEYEFAAQLMGAKIVKVPLKDFRHDLLAMRDAVTPATKLVFICNPNNPTGTIVSGEDLGNFMRSLPPGVVVVFDEAYSEYVDAPEYSTGLEFLRKGANCIVLKTFSKIYGLAGLRIGYGVASPELIGLLGRVREPFNVNLMAQTAAVAALSDEAHLARSRETNSAGKAFLTSELEALGLLVVPSQANFLFVRAGVDSKELFKRLLLKGVIIRTGDIFGHPDFIRVTAGTPDENRRFIAALQETLSTMREEAAKQ